MKHSQMHSYWQNLADEHSWSAAMAPKQVIVTEEWKIWCRDNRKTRRCEWMKQLRRTKCALSAATRQAISRECRRQLVAHKHGYLKT